MSVKRLIFEFTSPFAHSRALVPGVSISHSNNKTPVDPGTLRVFPLSTTY